MKKLSVLVPIAGALFGLAACAPMGTTAKEPATTSPVDSPATSAPTNPVTGTPARRRARLPAAAAVRAAPKPQQTAARFRTRSGPRGRAPPQTSGETR
jgi:hypothetical protein